MDFEDGSERLKHVLLKHKQVLQDASKRKGEIPYDRPHRSQLVTEFNTSLLQKQVMLGRRQDRPFVHTSFVPPAYFPCTNPRTKLKQIFIRDLQLETHHRDRYLLVRCITEADRMTALMVIVEDEKGDAVLLQMYNQEKDGDRPPHEVISLGTVYLIKDPYFKVMVNSGYGLRVDHVSDLVLINGANEMLPTLWIDRVLDLDRTVDEWKLEGDSAMKCTQYSRASLLYSTALTQKPLPQMEQKILLNRALAHLKDERFEGALADCNAVLSINPDVEKAMYRAARAHYGLRRFSESERVLSQLLSQYPSNDEASRELKRVKRRLQEIEAGEYDFDAISKELEHTRPPYLDHADYTAPVVVKISPGRGRGLFATRAIQAGELLLCEKALVYCFDDNSGKSNGQSDHSALINLATDRVTLGNQGALIQTTVQKLWLNPSLISVVYDLHHGDYQAVDPTEVDDQPIIDTFLVERVISLNAFASSLRSTPQDFHDEVSPSAGQRAISGCGIWPLASMINHSCTSNVRRSFIGDLQIVRATRDINAGSELTFWYRVPKEEDTYDDVQEGLRHWGFKCQCELCQELQTISRKQRKQRDGLFADLRAALQDDATPDLNKVERLITAVTKTYKSSSQKLPRLRIASACLAVAEEYYTLGMLEKAAQMAAQILAACGFVVEGAESPLPDVPLAIVREWGLMTQHVPRAWMLLWNICRSLGSNLFTRVDTHARTAYAICYGDASAFDRALEA